MSILGGTKCCSDCEAEAPQAAALEETASFLSAVKFANSASPGEVTCCRINQPCHKGKGLGFKA